MRRLLSTRRLSGSHIERLQLAGWELTQYNAISVQLLPATLDPGDRIAIFTSRHAVEACFQANENLDRSGISCLCVGNKTAELLEEKGLTVLETQPSASALADRIQDKYTKRSFVYYCGDRRLDILPDKLDELKLEWLEVVVYKTTLLKRTFEDSFDGVLFFSPSGVESFANSNSMKGVMAFCIGRTTAMTANKYTNRFKIATTPSVDAVIALAESEGNEVNQ